MSVKLLVVLSVNVFIILANEINLLELKSQHQDGNNRNKIGLEAYGYGIYRCPLLSGSMPKAETGCCGRHYQQERATYNSNKLINKRSTSSEEVFDEDDYYDDINADYTDYEYDRSEDVNDTLASFREKRAVVADSDIPPNKFIVAGHAVDINVYPWLVHLETKGSVCGGSLINSKYVLTAAHCVHGSVSSLNDVYVVLAEYDTRTKYRDCVQYRNGQQRCVDNVVMHPEQIIKHPRYHFETNDNDIAMLRLRGKAPYTEFIRPICLPTFDIDSARNRGLDLVVAGWGMMVHGGPASPIKLQTMVNLVPFPECRAWTPVPRGKLCAIGQSGQDACYGDSGGPLMAYYKGSYILAGIVSGKHTIGAPCGSRVPTAYVNVYQYLRWIQSNMRP